MTELPRALTRDQEFLAAIATGLRAQHEVLTQIRDRLPAPEGEQPATAPAAPAEVEVTEPAPPPEPAEPAVPLAEPAAPAKRPPAKKPAPKTGTRKTSSTRATGRAHNPKGTS